ncbi:MAG: hypothetical protein KIG65_03395 [Eubacteriales bacterium]|nr:hypothetical protein [Eubacteriales bacterium]MDY3305053.1 hypothetical protein [Clostridia bacterium]
MFEGFKTINLAVGYPNLSITKNGVTFNKASVIKLGKPAMVKLMINEAEKQIAIQVADENDENATPFVKGEKKFLNVRWNYKDFVYSLAQMMNWDLEKDGYKVMGEYFSNEDALLFDLKKATKLTVDDEE